MDWIPSTRREKQILGYSDSSGISDSLEGHLLAEKPQAGLLKFHQCPPCVVELRAIICAFGTTEMSLKRFSVPILPFWYV